MNYTFYYTIQNVHFSHTLWTYQFVGFYSTISPLAVLLNLPTREHSAVVSSNSTLHISFPEIMSYHQSTRENHFPRKCCVNSASHAATMRTVVLLEATFCGTSKENVQKKNICKYDVYIYNEIEHLRHVTYICAYNKYNEEWIW